MRLLPRAFDGAPRNSKAVFAHALARICCKCSQNRRCQNTSGRHGRSLACVVHAAKTVTRGANPANPAICVSKMQMHLKCVKTHRSSHWSRYYLKKRPRRILAMTRDVTGITEPRAVSNSRMNSRVVHPATATTHTAQAEQAALKLLVAHGKPPSAIP